jgi:hypothetical protein
MMRRLNRNGALAGISPVLLGLALLQPAEQAKALPNPAGQSTITMPAAGVVCDGTNQLCYNRDGLSLQLTGTYFGQYARQTAQQNFGSRLPVSRFELSNGVFCQSDRQSCWRMKNGKRTPADHITNQLYGNAPTPFPNPSPFPNPTPYPGPTPYPQPGPGAVSHTGNCRLLRGNQQLFNGSCALREIRQGFQPRFEVNLRQGPTYVFEQSNRGTVIADESGGRWPVNVEDRGNRGIFRWADYRLDVTQRNYNPESGGTSKFQRAMNNFLMDLFN